MMSKAQALAEFREFYLPAIRRIEQASDGRIDVPMRREEWNNYTDMLCKDRRITSRQYETWSNPF